MEGTRAELWGGGGDADEEARGVAVFQGVKETFQNLEGGEGEGGGEGES